MPLAPGSAREAVVEKIRSDIESLEPSPQDLSEAAASQKLRLSDQCGLTGAGLVSLKPELLFLRPHGSRPPPVEELLGEGVAELVENIVRECVLAKQSARDRKRDARFKKAYLDATLVDEKKIRRSRSLGWYP